MNFFKVYFLIFLIILKTGCAITIGEKPREMDMIFPEGCLNELDKKVRSYFSGTLTKGEIKKTSSCIKDALRLFQQRVQGRNEGEFTPQELRRFFTELFIKDLIITDSFLDQLMFLKVASIGGTRYKLNNKDIDQLIKLIDTVEEYSVYLQPYINFLFQDHENGQGFPLNDEDEIKGLEKSISSMFSVFREFQKSYSFHNMSSLIKELGYAFRYPFGAKEVETNIELFAKTKQFLVGGNKQHIAPEEWEPLSKGYFELVMVSLYYNLLSGKPKNELLSIYGINRSSMGLEHFLKFLLHTTENRKYKTISKNEFRELSKVLYKLRVTPRHVDISTLESIIDGAFHLKVGIIGGNENQVNERELNHLMTFISKITSRIIGSISADKDKNTSVFSLSNLMDRSFFDLSESFRNPVNIGKMNLLVQDLGTFFNQDIRNYNITEFQTQRVFMIKKLIIGGVGEMIAPGEWRDIQIVYQHISKIYDHYSLLNNLENQDISVKNTGYVIRIIDELVLLGDHIIASKPDKVLSYGEIKEWIELIEQLGLIPDYIKEKSVDKMLDLVFGKVLNTGAEQKRIIQLDIQKWEKLKLYLQRWKNIQNFINIVFNENDQVENTVRKETLINHAGLHKLDDLEKKWLERILSIRLTYGTENNIDLYSYLGQTQITFYNFKNLTIFNFYHLLTEFIESGYGKKRANEIYINFKGFKEFFYDFFPFGDDMGWFTEPLTNNLLDDYYVYANMLMPYSKGYGADWSVEEKFQTEEIINFFVLALSIKGSLDQLIVTLSDEHNCQKGEKNVKNLNDFLFDRKCVEKVLLQSLPLGNFPDLRKYIEFIKEEGKLNELKEALIHAAYETDDRYKTYKTFNSVQLQMMVVSLYIIETAFGQYDKNNDFVLSDQEIWAAYSGFRGYILRVMLDLMCLTPKFFIFSESIYAYVIHHKKLPNSRKLDEITKEYLRLGWDYLLRKGAGKNFDFIGIRAKTLSLDRIGLAKVFSESMKGLIRTKEEFGGTEKEGKCGE